MDPADLFGLVDIKSVKKQVNLANATIWKRVKDKQFPQPIGGRRRACWSRIQVLDYLYQLSRYGVWSEERTNEVLDSAHAGALNINLNSTADDASV